MENSVTFHLSSSMVPFSQQNPDVTSFGFTPSNVKKIVITGDPWVFFNSPEYTGAFVVLGKGKHDFPGNLQNDTIQSLRLIKGGISNSELVLYRHPFFEGTEKKITSDSPLSGAYFSLKVTKGAMVFYEEKEYEGESSIMLNGDKVQNFSAMKSCSVGKSVKPAEVTK